MPNSMILSLMRVSKLNCAAKAVKVSSGVDNCLGGADDISNE